MKTQKDLFRDIPPDEMPFTKVRAFLEEFPWIRKVLSDSVQGIQQVYVQTAEESILTQSPHTYAGVCVEFKETLFLITEDGEVVESKKVEQGFRRKYALFGPKIQYSWVKTVVGKTRSCNLQSIIRQLNPEDLKKVKFILSHMWGIVIIYKIPAENLAVWLENQVQDFRQEFAKDSTES